MAVVSWYRPVSSICSTSLPVEIVLEWNFRLEFPIVIEDPVAVNVAYLIKGLFLYYK